MQNVDLAQIIQNVKSARFLVVDRTVAENYRTLRAEFGNKIVFYLDEPEKQKDLKTLEECLEFFLENHMTRDEKILAIGGGATTDFAGFVAATILRGVKWEAYPTTLLGMVDAAIGGKVAVNSQFGKNLIGNFHHPEEVYICTDFLSTLPKEEMLSGYGEVMKYTFLSTKVRKLIKEEETIPIIIKECARYKEELVAKDFEETDLRKTLNLGHTFGHPIEKVTGIPHGIAVMLGLKIIVDLYADHLKDEFNQIIAHFDFNFDIPAVEFEQFWTYLQNDKKVKKDQTIDLIIPKEIGDVVVKNYPLEVIKEKLKNYELYATFFY